MGLYTIPAPWGSAVAATHVPYRLLQGMRQLASRLLGSEGTVTLLVELLTLLVELLTYQPKASCLHSSRATRVRTPTSWPHTQQSSKPRTQVQVGTHRESCLPSWGCHVCILLCFCDESLYAVDKPRQFLTVFAVSVRYQMQSGRGRGFRQWCASCTADMHACVSARILPECMQCWSVHTGGLCRGCERCVRSVSPVPTCRLCKAC